MDGKLILLFLMVMTVVGIAAKPSGAFRKHLEIRIQAINHLLSIFTFSGGSGIISFLSVCFFLLYVLDTVESKERSLTV